MRCLLVSVCQHIKLWKIFDEILCMDSSLDKEVMSNFGEYIKVLAVHCVIYSAASNQFCSAATRSTARLLMATCPSVTRPYCIETYKDIIRNFSRPCSPTTTVFVIPHTVAKF